MYSGYHGNKVNARHDACDRWLRLVVPHATVRSANVHQAGWTRADAPSAKEGPAPPFPGAEEAPTPGLDGRTAAGRQDGAGAAHERRFRAEERACAQLAADQEDARRRNSPWSPPPADPDAPAPRVLTDKEALEATGRMEKEQREEEQHRQEQAVGAAEGPPPGFQVEKSAGEEASASSGPRTTTQHWPLGHLASAGGLAAATCGPAQEQRPDGGHDHPAEAGGRPHPQPEDAEAPPHTPDAAEGAPPQVEQQPPDKENEGAGVQGPDAVPEEPGARAQTEQDGAHPPARAPAGGAIGAFVAAAQALAPALAKAATATGPAAAVAAASPEGAPQVPLARVGRAEGPQGGYVLQERPPQRQTQAELRRDQKARLRQWAMESNKQERQLQARAAATLAPPARPKPAGAAPTLGAPAQDSPGSPLLRGQRPMRQQHHEQQQPPQQPPHHPQQEQQQEELLGQ